MFTTGNQSINQSIAPTPRSLRKRPPRGWPRQMDLHLSLSIHSILAHSNPFPLAPLSLTYSFTLSSHLPSGLPLLLGPSTPLQYPFLTTTTRRHWKEDKLRQKKSNNEEFLMIYFGGMQVQTIFSCATSCKWFLGCFTIRQWGKNCRKNVARSEKVNKFLIFHPFNMAKPSQGAPFHPFHHTTPCPTSTPSHATSQRWMSG